MENTVERTRLAQSARNAYPDFDYRRKQMRGGGVNYYFCATVIVEGYEPRRVTVLFHHHSPWSPEVLVDGPENSPHRLPSTNGRRRLLCLWHPDEEADRRWIPEDGLLALFGMATIHLFKEAWYREHHIWIGDEYPHDHDELKVVV